MPAPTFQTFDDAWNEFIQTGHFSLNNSTLSLNELYQLHGYVKKSCSDPLYIYLCIVHLIRNSLRYVPYKDMKAVAADLKNYLSCYIY